MPQVSPGHSIAAVTVLKSSLFGTAGGKGAEICPKTTLAGPWFAPRDRAQSVTWGPVTVQEVPAGMGPGDALLGGGGGGGRGGVLAGHSANVAPWGEPTETGRGKEPPPPPPPPSA